MTISCECECGTTFKVSDNFAGREVRCRDCGAMITVAGEMADEESVAGRSSGKKKAKKKSKSPVSATEGMTLEERIAARTVEDEANRSRLAEIFTGDIRPLLVGVCSVLLGIGSIVLAIMGPGQIGEEAARDRTLDEAMRMTRNERMGSSVLGGIYETFGATGVMIFLIFFGLGLIIGGSLVAYIRWGFSSDDD